ncbi:MAG TPA: ABC transporter substrate-binding protein, partial [Trueperaceae bacterium]
MIIEAVYESLVEWDPKQEKLVPMLATAWKVTPDGLSYTFEIRQGVKFHDGSTLTARDVKVSLDRIREIGLGNSYLLGPVKSVTAIDDYTVEVTLSEPYAPFLAGLPLAYIVSSTAIAKHDQGDLSRDWLSMNEAGTGPYVLASWDLNQQFTL